MLTHPRSQFRKAIKRKGNDLLNDSEHRYLNDLKSTKNSMDNFFHLPTSGSLGFLLTRFVSGWAAILLLLPVIGPLIFRWIIMRQVLAPARALGESVHLIPVFTEM